MVQAIDRGRPAVCDARAFRAGVAASDAGLLRQSRPGTRQGRISAAREKRDTMLVNLRNIFTRMDPTKQDMHTLHGVVMAITEGRKGPAKGGVLDGEQATQFARAARRARAGAVRPAKSGTVRGLARLLRRNPTDARAHPVAVADPRPPFCRAVQARDSVGRRIPDFVSFVHRLAIELTNPGESEPSSGSQRRRSRGSRRATIGCSGWRLPMSSAIWTAELDRLEASLR